jgi:hypothetical protein
MKTKNLVKSLVLAFLLSGLLAISACQSQSVPPAPKPIENESEDCWNMKELAWEQSQTSSDVEAYYVRLAYEGSDGQFEEAKEFGPIEKMSYEMPIDCGNVFRWSVRVVNDEGVSSEWSNWIVDDSGVPPG